MSLHRLALALHEQGDLTGAQPLFERALAIREKALGSEHPDTERSRDDLRFLLNDRRWHNKTPRPPVAKKPSSATMPLSHIGGRREGFLPNAISPDDAIVTISLKDVPRRAWKKVRAELAYVVKVAVETDGKATVLRPPSKRRVSELSESSLEKKRERERKNMATYRQRLRAKAAGSPQP